VLVSSTDKQTEAKTASGIILPGKEGNEKHEHGKVVAVGGGRTSSDGKRIAMDVKVGDKVVFKRGYDAEEVILDGGEYLLMSESSIIGIEA
jgi:chaperonin GroES